MIRLERWRRGKTMTTRREFLQVGYSGLLGLGLPGLLAARSAASSMARGTTTSRARSVIVILLSGGLGQHDSFDMKPEAPDKMRGEFKPIETAVPGIRICEHLPGLAARAGRLAIIRTMAHPEGNHLLAVHRVLTGHPSSPRGASDLDRVASRDDFPCYAAVLDSVRRRNDGIPNGVALPLRLVEGPLTWPGQDAGFLGPRYDPWQLRLDPNRSDSRDESLALADGLSPDRLHRRRHLLGQSAVPPPGDAFLDQQDAALAMLCNGRVGRALDLDREDPRLVDRYGRHWFRPLAADRAATRRGRRADHSGDDGDRPDLGYARRQLPAAEGQPAAAAGSGRLELCSMTWRPAACWMRPWL